jgi:3-phosphoshikimate 1-carboxyvinyltransferase
MNWNLFCTDFEQKNMIVTVYPSLVAGKVLAPRSKSSMQRACAAALLHRGTTVIVHPGKSHDDLAARDVITRLGAVLHESADMLTVTSRGVEPLSPIIHCGESGLGIRMFTPIASLSPDPLSIRGSGSLVKRPMDFFDEIFPELGVSIRSNGGRLPLDINGPLKPADITVDGSLSSQFLTGLLMAFSAAGARDVTITVKGLKSRPYIDLTLAVMKAFDMKLPEVIDYEQFRFNDTPAPEQPSTIRYAVEGDWSGAAFLLVAGAVAGPCTIDGLEWDSTQADRAILDAIEKAGAVSTRNGDSITIYPALLNGFRFDATECPDLFPPLVALASVAQGDSFFQGAGRLTHKESNRALTLQEEFGKLGVVIVLDGDVMIVKGGSAMRAASVFSHHDHRIAMACAIAALRADGPVIIHDAEAINKSYPDFFRDIALLGARVELIS